MFKNFKKLLKIPGGRYIIVEHGEPQYVVLNFKDYMKLAGACECECGDEDYESDEDDDEDDDEDFVAEDWSSELNRDLEEAEEDVEKEEVKKDEPEITVEPEKLVEKDVEGKEDKGKEDDELKVEDLPF